MVTGFHFKGVNFSFAAPVAWVMHGLGAGVGEEGEWGFFAFCLKDIIDCNNVFFCFFLYHSSKVI